MWRFHNPVAVTFGAGVLAQIGAALKGRRYALITYGEPLFTSLTRRISAVAGPACTVIDRVTPNPDFRDLEPLCPDLLADGQAPDVIVALGGGSVIDTAKALAAAQGDFGIVRDHLERRGGPFPGPTIPIIAVPTTAGTGSEVTCWATVWDSTAGKKYSLAGPTLYPEQALIDPELTLGLPRSLTVSTGLDALSHALESLWNRNANPVSTNFAVAAARTLLEALPKVAKTPDDLALRSQVARAAMMAGLAFSNTKTALAHSLSYPITLHHGVPHGIACSFSLPMVMRSAIGNDPDCDAALRRIFGDDLEAGIARLAEILADLGVSARAADHGVKAEEWDALVDDAFAGERGQNFIGSRGRFSDAGAER